MALWGEPNEPSIQHQVYIFRQCAHEWLLMVTKGCIINQELASVKFCDSFSSHLSITAV